MARFSTPGVTYERVDAGAPPVSALRTDIAGFVGIARRGPLHRAVPVDTWRQFQAWFGDFTGAGYLAYAVRAYFENGGRRAWIVRIASDAAAAASSLVDAQDPLTGLAAGNAWRIAASSAGVWGNDLAVRLVETHRAQTRLRPRESTPAFSAVNAVAGFVRGTLVRVPVAPNQAEYRVVSEVDADLGRLYWINPDPTRRRDWEAALDGLDPDAELVLESVEYSLVVRAGGRMLAAYEGLATVPDHPDYGPRRLAGLPPAPADARGWRVADAPEPVAIDELRDAAGIAARRPLFANADEVFLAGGADGLAALSVRDFIGEATSPLDADAVRLERTRGLRALESVDEVAVVAVPDIHVQAQADPEIRPLPACVPDPCLPPPPPGPAPARPRGVGDLPPRFDADAVYRVQAAQLAHCEARRDRVALLDAPFETVRDPRLGATAIRAWRRRFDSSYAALYYPWAKVSDPLRPGDALTRDVPCSGHVAGFIAGTDLKTGVHKAPANGVLAWLQDVTADIDDATHGLLNDERINVLRAYPGRGLRIAGARTLSADRDWRYLNVRRLLLMIEKAIGVSCQWAAFEPNAERTRAKLHLALTSFLLALWQRGALAGKSARSAFFVRCDEGNNPAPQRDLGRLVAEIGVAPAQPFEFVLLRVGRVENQFEVSEAGTARGGG